MGTCSSQPTIKEEIQVAHFTPASFPLIPNFNKNTTKICKKSWDMLMKMTYKSSKTGLETSSITVFYNEFYRKLYLYDTRHQFDAILARHLSGGGSNIAAKGAIIVRIVKFALGLENDKKSIERLRKLGKAHNHMGIQGWQYSVFIEILLNTIACQLDVHASWDVMTCWVNLFTFIFQHMLPSALKGHVKGTDLNVAIHTEHVERDIESAAHQVADGVVCTSHSKNSRLNSLKEDVLGEEEEKCDQDKKQKAVAAVNPLEKIISFKEKDQHNGLRLSQTLKLTTQVFTTDTESANYPQTSAPTTNQPSRSRSTDSKDHQPTISHHPKLVVEDCH